jgi:DNA-binding NarL/FixJ family response regulator
VDSVLGAASAPDERAGAGVEYAALAQALVDGGATTKSTAVVASILSAHADGKALNRIASDMGIHHKTVSKIIDAAEAHRQRDVVAV